ncbi:hypothetical protein Syun_018928 [Stephania yunnanensis]|uniref:Uncharacterized protein n=1 Tax=Stephania yunnanensis TaxID=152371 RepID=A0AAP0IT67_9MAGN
MSCNGIFYWRATAAVAAARFQWRPYLQAKLQRRRQELTQTTPDQTVDDEAVY